MDQAQMIGSVVIALVALAGLYFTISKPMLSNQKIMVELTCTIKELNSKLIALETKNSDSHKRMHEELEEHEKTLRDHEMRLHDLDGK